LQYNSWNRACISSISNKSKSLWKEQKLRTTTVRIALLVAQVYTPPLTYPVLILRGSRLSSLSRTVIHRPFSSLSFYLCAHMYTRFLFSPESRWVVPSFLFRWVRLFKSSPSRVASPPYSAALARVENFKLQVRCVLLWIYTPVIRHRENWRRCKILFESWAFETKISMNKVIDCFTFETNEWCFSVSHKVKAANME